MRMRAREAGGREWVDGWEPDNLTRNLTLSLTLTLTQWIALIREVMTTPAKSSPCVCFDAALCRQHKSLWQIPYLERFTNG